MRKNKDRKWDAKEKYRKWYVEERERDSGGLL